jgi:hypothetical protein
MRRISEDEDDDEHEDDRVAATPRYDLRDLCVSLSRISGGKAGRLSCQKIFHVGRERRREGESSFEFERQGGGV